MQSAPNPDPYRHPTSPGLSVSDEEAKDDGHYPTYEAVVPTSSPLERPHSTFSRLADAFLPSILGLIYVIFCIYVAYSGKNIIISHSTDHATEIRGLVTALTNIWIFFCLLFVDNLVDRIRSEEWHRRLSIASHITGNENGLIFAHLNHVSSNLGGTLRHAVDLFTFFPGSSRVFKVVFLSALLSLALNELAPSLLQVVVEWYSIGIHNIPISALPLLSIHANLSEPFSGTDSVLTPATFLATALALGGSNSLPGVVVPVPTILIPNGWDMYASDLVFLTYSCKWLAPTYISEPMGDNVQEVLVGGALYGAAGFFGSGRAPFYPNTQTGPLDELQANTPWYNFSSAPQSPVPSSWRLYQEQWATIQNNSISTDVSILLCLPQITIQPYLVTFSSLPLWKSDEPLTHKIGNIDETQLKIAMSDSLGGFADRVPGIFYRQFVSEAMTYPNSTNHVYYPIDETVLSKRITTLVQNALAAYLTGGPFGTAVVPSYGYRDGLILRSQIQFLWVVAALFLFLTVAGALVLVLQRREKGITRQLSVSGVLRLTRCDTETPVIVEKWFNGQKVKEIAKDLAGGRGMTEEGEENVHFAFRNARVRVTHFQASDEMLQMQTTSSPMPKLEVEARKFRKIVELITPGVGGTFIAFGAYAYTHDVVIPGEIGENRLVLLGTLFTAAIGFWRTLALGGTRSSIREEWTRLSDRATSQGQMEQEKVRRAIDDISTNTTSIVDQLRRSFLFSPKSLISGYYRLAFLSFLVMSVCSIASQGAIQLHRRVVPTGPSETVAINSYSAEAFSVYSLLTALGEPWRTSVGLGSPDADPYIDFLIQQNIYTSAFGYLHSELDYYGGLETPSTSEEGYFLMEPLKTTANASANAHFLTDLGVWKMVCEWAAPQLQPWSADINSSSFVSIQLTEHNLQGFVQAPHGYSWFRPLQRPQSIDSEDFISTGLFAWTLFAGSRINTDSVPFSNLSTEWQDWISGIVASSNPKYASFYETPTRMTTLICEPNIKILYGSEVTIYNNTASIRKRNREQDKIGNLDFGQVAFQVYARGSMLAESEAGRFSDNLLIGSRAGKVALSNSSGANSIKLRRADEAARSLNRIMTSELIFVAGVNSENATTLSAPVGERHVVDVSLPQLVASGVMFAILSLFIVVFQLRTRLRNGFLKRDALYWKLVIVDGQHHFDWDFKNSLAPELFNEGVMGWAEATRQVGIGIGLSARDHLPGGRGTKHTSEAGEEHCFPNGETRVERMRKNRISAAKSRKKKKEWIESLNDSKPEAALPPVCFQYTAYTAGSAFPKKGDNTDQPGVDSVLPGCIHVWWAEISSPNSETIACNL
ncbi:hypothetical protein BT69DRAFT_1326292 [Atractiella rhizophila]|nr:hypothetical protein BT69DRAFT_1326292 [Atractiella rhizophila]